MRSINSKAVFAPDRRATSNISGFHRKNRVSSFAAVALLQLAFLVMGPVASARADVVNCAIGDGLINGGEILNITLNTTTGVCVLSQINTPLPAIDNGVRVALNPSNSLLDVQAQRYENGAFVGKLSGTDFSITNYTGGRINSAYTGGLSGFVQFEDNIPDAAGSSTISFTTLINGSPVTLTVSSVTKTDGIKDTSFTQVSFGYTPVSTSVTSKAKIADYLLSSFNKVDDGIFGPGGIPINIAEGTAGDESFSLSPIGRGSALSLGSLTTIQNPMDQHFGLLSLGMSSDAGTGGKGFNFSFNLQNMIANQHNQERQALGLGARAGVNGGPYQPRSRWNAFAMGRYTDFDDDNPDADRDGHLWSITSGVSYALSEKTAIGAFTRFRQGKVSSTALDASLDSDFFGGGLFLSTTFDNGMRVMAAGLYEDGDNDIVIEGDSSSFDTDQITLEARIDKRFIRGRHWIEPAIKILYTNLDRGGFSQSSTTTSLNALGAPVTTTTVTDIASGGSILGRLTYGPTIGTTIDRGNAILKPFARIKGIWDFIKESDFTLDDGTIISSADMAIKVGGGMEILFDSGLTMSLAGDWFSFDNDLDGVTMTGSLSVPLSVLGMSQAGLASFDSSSDGGKTHALSGRLRVKF